MEENLGHVLVIEDEYLIAVDLVEALQRLGVKVVGPYAGIAEATTAIEKVEHLDGAILDLNLRGELSFPVAEALQARHVPFVFTSGYEQVNIPTQFRDVPLVTKPADPVEVARKLAALIASSRVGSQ